MRIDYLLVRLNVCGFFSVEANRSQSSATDSQSFDNFQSSILNPQFSILNPQFSILNPEERLVDLPPFKFWETRTGAGTPVVLIHGLSGSGKWWKHNIDALAKEHLVAAVDLVGFGRNRRFLGGSILPLTFDDAAAVLVRWIESSFDEPVHLIGHSMGGQTAIHVAALRPDLVRSLVLVNSTGVPFEIDPLSHLRNIYPAPRGLITFSRVLVWDFLRAGPTSVGVAAARLLTNDARELLERISLPTLIVWGDRDPIVPDVYGRRMRERMAEADLVVLPKAGHVAMWDNPAEFNRHVLEFLRHVELQPHVRVENVAPSFNWGIAGKLNGITYRRSGSGQKIVLVHGLGVSSTYFRPLARELHRHGFEVFAPDLPGFGYSLDLAADPASDPAALISWAKELGIESAIWVGQSTGCQTVEGVRRAAPALVEKMFFISPVWTQRRNPAIYLASKLAVDAVLESPALLFLAITAYWRAGLLRFIKAWMYYVEEATHERTHSAEAIAIIGRDDPLVDPDYIRLSGAELLTLSGAHAVHWSNAEGVADVIARMHPRGSLPTPSRAAASRGAASARGCSAFPSRCSAADAREGS